jgi:hypothetical protein
MRMSGGARPAVIAPVSPLHEAVHDGLRMDEHLELVGREPEQVMRLDEFEALVHEGRRIDVDLGAHRPGRVAGGLDRRGARDALPRPSPKRSAGRRDGRRGDILDRTGRERLRERVVLRIHRLDRHSKAARVGHEEDPGADERLLVRERNALPRLQGRVRRAQAGRAADRRDNDVGITLGRIEDGSRPGARGDSRACQPALELLARGRCRDGCELGAKVPRDRR